MWFRPPLVSKRLTWTRRRFRWFRQLFVSCFLDIARIWAWLAVPESGWSATRAVPDVGPSVAGASSWSVTRTPTARTASTGSCDWRVRRNRIRSVFQIFCGAMWERRLVSVDFNVVRRKKTAPCWGCMWCSGFLRSLENSGKMFDHFPVWKCLETNFFWSVSMKKENTFQDLIFWHAFW